MGFGPVLDLALLNLAFGGETFVPPTTVYVALGGDASPSDTVFTELSGDTYARAAVDNNTTTWQTADDTHPKQNLVDVLFPEAGAAWTQAKCFRVYNAATDGDMLGWGVLDTPMTAVLGSCLRFKPGDLVVELD